MRGRIYFGELKMKKTIIVTLLGVAFTPVTFADQAVNVDDVVVTATRTPQPRENVIADVTVIDQEEIQRSGQSNLVDVLQRQPGIEITSNGGPGKLSGVFLRGTNSDHIVVLVDGIRINSASSGTTAFENLPIDLIDRVEVLRGPAASLYGQDAIGGVIQIFTKKVKANLVFTPTLVTVLTTRKKLQLAHMAALATHVMPLVYRPKIQAVFQHLKPKIAI